MLALRLCVRGRDANLAILTVGREPARTLSSFKSLHFLDRFTGRAFGVFELPLAAALLAEVASVE